MVWINKSITCSEKPWIILIVTLCEGKWLTERKRSVGIFCYGERSKRLRESDALKSHNLATNLASELFAVFL